MQQPNLSSVVRRFWGVVLVLALLGAAGGAARELSRPAAYASTVRIFVSNSAADNIPVSQSSSLTIQRMDSYVLLVGSTQLAQALVDQLGLRDSARSVAGSLSATTQKDTVLMTVSARSASADESAAIAGAVPDELTTLVNTSPRPPGPPTPGPGSRPLTGPPP